ncbi:hypothetical protein CEXT_197881 [Caerostris extrusa]|uniref:Uncharacterized protein n=1 Tax=Caerostris extrusa TaxID=172846 RepID=A0AAV4Q7M3_CAEEX|nr:hypothetical protein CEXT_197881 [Caerostris extrusa]
MGEALIHFTLYHREWLHRVAEEVVPRIEDNPDAFYSFGYDLVDELCGDEPFMEVLATCSFSIWFDSKLDKLLNPCRTTEGISKSTEFNSSSDTVILKSTETTSLSIRRIPKLTGSIPKSIEDTPKFTALINKPTEILVSTDSTQNRQKQL